MSVFKPDMDEAGSSIQRSLSAMEELRVKVTYRLGIDLQHLRGYLRSAAIPPFQIDVLMEHFSRAMP